MGIVTAAAIMGSHVRVGLEDSLYLGKGQIAESTASQGQARAGVTDRYLGDASRWPSDAVHPRRRHRRSRVTRGAMATPGATRAAGYAEPGLVRARTAA